MSLAECVERIKTDASLPVPPAKIVFTGGAKNFLETGADLMKTLVEWTGLGHDADVLDIGSGLGRVAVPLTQWLRMGTYRGVEVVSDAVGWCQANITPRFPNFQFVHLDLENETYNRGGQLRTAETRLPFDDESFDVAFLFSVFTHLELRDTSAYLNEIARVLRPGGQLFGTWFFAADDLPAEFVGKVPTPMILDPVEGVYYMGLERSLNVVAFRESVVHRIVSEAGLEIVKMGHGDGKPFRSQRQEPLLCRKPA